MRIDESAEGIDQVVMVVKVTAVDAVLLVKAVIEPYVVFPVVERVGLLEGSVVRSRRVRVSNSQSLHSGIDSGDSCSIRGDTDYRPVQS